MLKALLVGAGSMGRAWARVLSANPDVQLVGWADVVPDAAAKAIDELKLVGVGAGMEMSRMIAELKPDFMVNVTPPDVHHTLVIEALEAGLPVIGEKPMADSMEHARQIVAAAERTGKLHMISQNRRFDPRIRAFRALLTNIGVPEILNTDFYIGAHADGFRLTMPSPLLIDMAIHTFDAARFISSADAVSVYCETFNTSWSWWLNDASAVAMFEMTGGQRFDYRGSWSSDGRHTPWEAQWRAVGRHGSATWDGDQEIVADVITGDSHGTGGSFFQPMTQFKATPAQSWSFETGVAGALQEFLRALKTNTTPLCECHDNIKSLAMVFAAVESAAVGKRVKVEA
ncbi:MAG: Gfo/Idh/MocA family oxidoreductase [Anaerolineae bacterium]|nr:Gfo/Idh/MocA family oxidoreductase [Anaerolineae bacterium]